MAKEEGIKMSTMTVPFHWATIGSKWLLDDDNNRLDASFYSQDIVEGRILIEKLRQQGIKISKLGDSNISENIFFPGRFKRKYVSKNIGKPFLTASEIFMFSIKARKFVVDFPESVLVEPNWILITRSGSVGRSIISNNILSQFILSDDLIRVIPVDLSIMGYLYAYLNTWIGQAFLTKTKYGATVKHIEPEHVANIPIPLLPESELKEINNKILEAHRIREEAQELLNKAEELFYRELGLPRIDEEDVEYFDREQGKIVRAFVTKASELELRLDASYHMPIIRKIVEHMRENQSGELVKLKELTKSIFAPNRFKRSYVNTPEEGIPFLQGSHIPMIKIFDIKYIWKKSRILEKILLKKNWILITRSGTVGRVAIVTDAWDGWAGSEHILRLIPKEDINAGYLLAFLFSIYGYYQILGKVYGGVVDEIAEKDVSLIENLEVFIPSSSRIENKIGNLVIEAYNKKDQANIIESEAVQLLEETLTTLTNSR